LPSTPARRWSLLAFSGYPSVRDIVSSVALTFFAFLGFGIVSFTAKDVTNPSHELPRAMYLALGIATVIYVASHSASSVSRTVEEVIDSGGTAIAKAAEPTLVTAGYWLMSVTALFATSGATNGGLYPASGLCEQLASVGQYPPVIGHRLGGRVPAGLFLTAVVAIVLVVGFDLNTIASIGSAIALSVFALVTVGHLRVRDQTGARLSILVIGLAGTVIVLVTFAVTTLVEEPSTLVAIVVVLLVSIGVDVGWKRSRDARLALP
jgi:amino acid transporter